MKDSLVKIMTILQNAAREAMIGRTVLVLFDDARSMEEAFRILSRWSPGSSSTVDEIRMGGGVIRLKVGDPTGVFANRIVDCREQALTKT